LGAEAQVATIEDRLDDDVQDGGVAPARLGALDVQAVEVVGLVPEDLLDACVHRYRGRATGYPAPPAQIRTCATNASGSCIELNTDNWFGWR
jgi:hypothetical protein